MTPEWDGLLLVDKASGPTSHDIVSLARRATGQRRIGHAGTLDPMASGLLPLVLGSATRLVRFLGHSPKSYRGTLRFGLETDTDDITGRVLSRHAGSPPEVELVLDAAAGWVGRSLQVPPRVSARKVGGERLYRLARRGETVDAPAKEIVVDRLDLRPGSDPATFEFEAEVSTGTYIRGLVRDLGRKLGCGATLASLRRTSIGKLELSAALPSDELLSDSAPRLGKALIPLEQMPLDLPTFDVEAPEEADRFCLGQAIQAVPGVESEFYRVLGPDGRLLGVAESDRDRLRPRVVLARATPGEPG